MTIFLNLFSFLVEHICDAEFCPALGDVFPSSHSEFALQWQNPSGEPHLESPACCVKRGSTVVSRAKEKSSVRLPYGQECLCIQQKALVWKNRVCSQAGDSWKNQHCSEHGKICTRCGLINGRARAATKGEVWELEPKNKLKMWIIV